MTFPGWHQETDYNGSEIDVKPFPNRTVVRYSMILNFVAVCSTLISSLWQHTATAATRYSIDAMGYGNIVATTGTATIVLGWTSFALLIISMIGLWAMYYALNELDELMSDDNDVVEISRDEADARKKEPAPLALWFAGGPIVKKDSLKSVKEIESVPSQVKSTSWEFERPASTVKLTKR